MKRIISIIAAVAFVANISAQTSVFSYSSDSITVDNKFIEELYCDTPEAKMPPCVLKLSEDVNVRDDSYTVKCHGYKGWEDEMGEYYIIEIYHKGKRILKLRNDIGWDYFKKEYTPASLLTTDKFFFTIPLDNSSVALMFNGACDANDPILKTIVVLKDGMAKLVYNKGGEILSATVENGVTTINLQLNVIEYDGDHKPYNGEKPILASLTFRDGMIYYTDK